MKWKWLVLLGCIILLFLAFRLGLDSEKSEGDPNDVNDVNEVKMESFFDPDEAGDLQ